MTLNKWSTSWPAIKTTPARKKCTSIPESSSTSHFSTSPTLLSSFRSITSSQVTKRSLHSTNEEQMGKSGLKLARMRSSTIWASSTTTVHSSRKRIRSKQAAQSSTSYQKILQKHLKNILQASRQWICRRNLTKNRTATASTKWKEAASRPQQWK